ncbi:hypothetical protein HK105_203874 [Polyrhizophydium stewartii]|uniref:Uncharacterized protein n=1 Tax=Polyrhizophydium stewartii TaxID=2732419 RepID=A0ABR4NAH1_9FUNG
MWSYSSSLWAYHRNAADYDSDNSTSSSAITIDTTPPGSGHVAQPTRLGTLSPAPILVDLSKTGLCSVPDNVASDENALRSTLNQQAMVINTLVHHLGLDLPDPNMHALRHAFDRIDSLQRSSDI